MCELMLFSQFPCQLWHLDWTLKRSKGLVPKRPHYLPPSEASEGKSNIKDNKYTLSFKPNQSHTFMACVPLFYLLLRGLYNDPNNYSIAGFSGRKGSSRAGPARLSLWLSGMVSVKKISPSPGQQGETHTESGACQSRISFNCIRQGQCRARDKGQ